MHKINVSLSRFNLKGSPLLLSLRNANVFSSLSPSTQSCAEMTSFRRKQIIFCLMFQPHWFTYTGKINLSWLSLSAKSYMVYTYVQMSLTNELRNYYS